MNWLLAGLHAGHLAVFALFALKYLSLDVSIKSFTENDIAHDKTRKIAAEIDALRALPSPSSPLFHRIIITILDAWRQDFLFHTDSSPMHQIHQLIAHGRAVPIMAVARVPTVTKASIRCIVSGARPVFFDLVENLDDKGLLTTEQHNRPSNHATGNAPVLPGRDSLLKRFFEAKRPMAMYGDDTWLRLFPEKAFTRHHSEFSFNILEHVRLDQMVRSGIAKEMDIARNSPQHAAMAIIFHFLGLDHIGHAFNNHPSLRREKLIEYDQDVTNLVEWIAESDQQLNIRTLMVVLGDHGMTRDGNHGGGTFEETHAAAIFTATPLMKVDKDATASSIPSPRQYHHEDIAMTLTMLSDPDAKPLADIPGVLIPEVLRQFVATDTAIQLLLINLRHFLVLLSDVNLPDLLVHEISAALRTPTIDGLAHSCQQLKNLWDQKHSSAGKGEASTNYIMIASIAAMALITLGVTYLCRDLLIDATRSFHTLLMVVAVLSLALCSMATSFILEEHVFWQTSLAALIITAFLQDLDNLRIYGQLLALQRVLRSWNAVGTLWINSPSISSQYLRGNPSVCDALVWLSVGGVLWLKWSRGVVRWTSFAPFSIAAALLALHKTDSPISGPYWAQGILSGFVLSWDLRDVDLTFLALAILLNKPHNAMALLLIHAAGSMLTRLPARPGNSLIRYFMARSSFHYLGLWNSVSAVDLTAGAVFTSQFDMLVGPIVLLFYVFSGPLLIRLSSLPKQPAKSHDSAWLVLWLRVLMSLGSVYFAFSHQYHLFNFDTFSPKILFEFVWAAYDAAWPM